MSELSVQINIAGRSYPLRIKREEEEGLRKVAKEIQGHLDKLRQTYAVKDNQDLLAMTLLEYANRLESKRMEEGSELTSNVLTDLDAFVSELSDK
ncbi:MAG: cell division protein ZapA [Flavobacteriales bacterium]|nr:cell division protein ZapA [Flavobacteriales bacterium]